MIKIEKPKKAYKLFRRKRSNGDITSLFINKKEGLEVGTWLKAEDFKTKGFAHRPGWHASHAPETPHLDEKDREWWEVEICNWKTLKRPQAQGGTWYLSEWIRLIKPVSPKSRSITKGIKTVNDQWQKDGIIFNYV